MKKITLFGFLLLSGFVPAKLIKTKVADGITVSLPTTLVPMAPDDVAQRYPSVRAPLGAYTNVDRDSDFSVNISATQWPDADIELAAKFFKSGIYNLYDRVDFISQGIHIVNKKKFIFYEFESRVNGNKMKESERQAIFRYAYVQYYIGKDRTLVFTFSCPKDRKPDWQETVRAMMRTIKMK
ncbi:MAG TPA: hypothetical protein VKQ08_11850 [Cyclobacteriaceae bacterium]|nr:hypothetical protein [Cyclobacteriaceae bacterium]